MNTRDAVTNGTSSLPWAPQSGVLTLRDWLAHLARTDRLATIDKPVALEHELAAIAKRLDGEQAAFFTKPAGHDIPVVSGFMSKRAWIAEAMGVAESQLGSRLRRKSCRATLRRASRWC
jgi:2,5-furandicarboxylate decarboxylase 1